MGEADTATTPCPRSTVEAAPLKAAKDKSCPFCGQAFTSSSLGRHLDLYLRPKNPKAPDGIHIVDEIRKIRGGITRRQAKGSVSLPKKEDGGERTPAGPRPSEASSTAAPSPGDEGEAEGEGGDEGGDEGQLDVGRTRGQFRNVSWGAQSSRAVAARTPEVRRQAARHTQRRAELEQRHKASVDGDTARATEMALRELLKSVREANAKACGAGLFDFDPYALNFPALCLHMLHAPSTLFSPTPFPTAESWSISPPGQAQFDALNRQVRERLLAHQRQRHVNRAYPAGDGSGASSAATSPLPSPPLLEPDPQKLFCHMADAYNHWTRQTEHTRHECWQLEILRAYARAHDRRRDTQAQLESARREIDFLKANRWTAGGPDLSPVSINLGSDVAKELGKHGMDYRNWDYDRLVDKWKTAIRESKAATSGMAVQKPLPSGPTSTRSGSMTSLPAQSFAATTQQDRPPSPVKAESALPFPAPPATGREPEGDQLDAEGDDDDDDDSINCQQRQIQHQHQHQPLSHFHGMPLQPTPIHPSQQLQHMQAQIHVSQAQAHAQVQAHAHAQAHAWAAARQHMNQSRAQDFRPHQHQQLSPHPQHISPHPQHMSPHPQHMGSANTSRRPSLAMMDPHAMDPNAVAALNGAMVMSTGMEGIETHQDQFLRMDMGLAAGFVGSNEGGMHGDVKFSS
ncbi:hypothetical protein P153DRAFT_371405 [Dothidotthia symphoricarpi CBS 119687]|uniref:Uncharacterized protein n=1 Tax=Dothidotthia symphoricarpi CBS 119687 TaxID=1392245 RepID=A0A6A5ZXU3_9PLEO|nr:uncharacterized protein P153DRAFT_371405 [Dothidotthia symphoricarpi CBS 119687]KAF2124096.1 hypothetical protein P153DRAFT_371405 [Dothidotthia symphoricarpi CBS 119687]